MVNGFNDLFIVIADLLYCLKNLMIKLGKKFCIHNGVFFILSKKTTTDFKDGTDWCFPSYS